MDSSKLILSEPASIPAIFDHLEKAGGLSEQKKIQAAKDFESVLLGKLLDEMKNSIGDWGFEESAASKQTNGIFWLCLSRYLADNGGIGLWKDIYQSVIDSEQTGKNDGVEA